MMKNKLITLLTIFALIIPVNAKELIPGGESCGVSLKYVCLTLFRYFGYPL